MNRITIETLRQIPVARLRTEHVERKGIGHPDTMCDCMMEAASVALSREYLAACGRVLHYNVDKALLVAGQSAPRPGGGRILQPMRLIYGDRATATVNGRTMDVGQIVQAAAQDWLKRSLRFVDPSEHVVYQNELLPGSPELVDIFVRPALTANDTSAAVGYAPLTETERLVIAAEAYLNSADFKRRFPEVGEDIKVMAFRRDRQLSITVAAAMVDRFIPDVSTYFTRKEEVREDLHRYLEGRLQTLDNVEIAVNTLDDPARGVGGIYLTVLGTSAEGADGGEVGRGNRVNGVISLHRPMSLEAAAGKNPVSHVGKIYNRLAHQIAARLYESIEDIEEVTVWLCSQIGQPLERPWSVAVEIITNATAAGNDFEAAVNNIIAAELAEMPALVDRLTRGELPVC